MVYFYESLSYDQFNNINKRQSIPKIRLGCQNIQINYLLLKFSVSRKLQYKVTLIFESMTLTV